MRLGVCGAATTGRRGSSEAARSPRSSYSLSCECSFLSRPRAVPGSSFQCVLRPGFAKRRELGVSDSHPTARSTKPRSWLRGTRRMQWSTRKSRSTVPATGRGATRRYVESGGEDGHYWRASRRWCSPRGPQSATFGAMPSLRRPRRRPRGRRLEGRRRPPPSLVPQSLAEPRLRSRSAPTSLTSRHAPPRQTRRRCCAGDGGGLGRLRELPGKDRRDIPVVILTRR